MLVYLVALSMSVVCVLDTLALSIFHEIGNNDYFTMIVSSIEAPRILF